MLRHHRQCDACGKVAEARGKPTGWTVQEGSHGERADVCGAHGGQVDVFLDRETLGLLWLAHWREITAS